MEQLTQCPLCQGGHSHVILKVKDHSVSQETFQIMQCNTCNFQYTNPRPDEKEIEKYYESSDYISHTDEGNNLVNSIYKMARKYTIRLKYNLVNDCLSKEATKSILDFGCGTGDFLHYFAKHDWLTYGMEPNEKARQIAKAKLRQPIFPEISAIKGSFSIITMWHVLEHVHQLHETIENLSQHLTDDGKLIIAVPNVASQDAEDYKEHWAALDVPRHLYHFTPDTISKLMAMHGFHLQQKLPMFLDAFYISLLSRKFSKGKQNYLSAVRMGLRSNMAARKSGNYSSNIYIFSK